LNWIELNRKQKNVKKLKCLITLEEGIKGDKTLLKLKKIKKGSKVATDPLKTINKLKSYSE